MKLEELLEEARSSYKRPVCCEPECMNVAARKGNGRHQRRCWYHHSKLYPGTRYAHLVYRKNCCEKCGFIPVHICQLEVDHKDGDHENSKESNLQTLCCNCHRLKTWQERNT